MKRIQLLLSLGLASAVLLAACGGDDDSGDDDSGQTPSATQTTATGQTPSGGDATNTPEPNDDNGNGGGISELEDLINDLAGKTFQATYEITSESDGEEQTGSMTIAQDEPRYATIMELEDGTIAIIENESGSFSCFGSGAIGTCSRSDGASGSIFDLRDVTDDTEDLSSYEKIDDRNVNGRDSSCWAGTDPDSGQESTFCISKSDRILTFTGSSDFQMTLTDYSDDVSDEIFELPYAVQ